jgi:hypothetical protein
MMKEESTSTGNSVVWPYVVLGTKIIGFLFVTFVGLLYYNQDKILYIPNPPGFPRTPDEVSKVFHDLSHLLCFLEPSWFPLTCRME